MSLQTAAEAVRQKGRGEDTMLIHMTPDEVKGLQALAMANGGSLTINPETGLPEAGFLKSLLPTLIGAGLTIFSGGAINPLTAGLITGGIETVRTGDIGRGLMAGLGAYGGAGFGSALTGAGQAANAATLGAGTPATTAQASTALGVPASSTQAQILAQQNAAMGLTPTESLSQIAQSAGAVPYQSGAEFAFQQAAPTTAMGQLSQAGTGLGNILGTTGTEATQAAARSAGMEALGGSATSAAMKGAAALAGPLTAVPPAQTIEPEESNYDGPYVPTERQVRFPTAERDPMDSSEFQFFDVVNPAPGFQTMASATPPTTDLSGEAKFAGIPVSLATNPDRMREYQANPNLYNFAEGGMTMDNGGFVVDAHTVSEIGNGSSDAGHEMLARIGGEPIKGPGDGVSDSIKANIGGVQEARVAKDESYLSRDDVKALGGGNLKKGEKMLYQLMAKAHESRKQKGRGQATGLDKLISRMA